MSIKLECEDLEPLKIKCTTAICDRDLHCFLPTRKVIQKGGGGPCRKCKSDLVDFSRTARRQLEDVEYTFAMLQRETIRAKFWRKPIDSILLEKARMRGISGIKGDALAILAKKVGPKSKGTPWDSRGTPYDGDMIFLGQHATATCCRRCIQEWHGIPDDRELTVEEIKYFVDLIVQYIQRRLPNLWN